jgi:hypothetical protein
MKHLQTKIAVIAATLLTGTVGLFAAQTADTAGTDSIQTKPGISDTQKTIVRIYGQFKSDKGLIIIKEPNDTLLTMENDQVKHCWNKKEKSSISMREKGFGIGGGYAFGIMAFGSGPVKDLAKQANELAGRQFQFNSVDFEPMVVTGGFGYLGMGNGLRIGGGGMGGISKRYVSDRFNGDSAATLRVNINYGGFLIEKGFVSGHVNYNVGGYIGGGKTKVTVEKIQGNTYDLPAHEQIQGNHNTVESGFTNLEIHAGCTYTLLPFFHLGLGVSAPLFYSPEGFNLYTAEYVTVNPVVQLRFVFGNLG